MGRWWIAWAIGGVVVSSLGVATTWSYLRTLHSQVGRSLRDAVPVSFELKRLDQMIQELVPEIRRNQEVVAQLEVEVEYLERDVKHMQGGQEELVSQMGKLREALGEGRQEYDFAGQSYTRKQVERDLARRLDQYEHHKAQLAAKQQLLEQRRRTLEAATAKVVEYRRQYEQLLAKAESLEAELKLVEAAQAAGRLEFDQSKLAQAKELAQEVEKRIRVLQRLVDAGRQPRGEIPVDADTRPVTERYDELFGPENAAPDRTGSET